MQHRERYLALFTLPLVLFAILSLSCGAESEATAETPTATVVAPTSTATLEPTPTEVPPTETPTPEPTPEPTATPVPPTPRPAAPAPSSGQSAPPPAPAGGGATSVFISADQASFSPRTVVVAANSPVTLTLQNNDAGVSHDLQVIGRGATDLCTGPCTRTTTLNSGPPGSYVFLCSLHPTMRGTFISQ